ncbi:hypothetical protein J3A83DRAFT_4232386 [Scleroderma citrinum]
MMMMWQIRVLLVLSIINLRYDLAIKTMGQYCLSSKVLASVNSLTSSRFGSGTSPLTPRSPFSTNGLMISL